MDLALNNLQRLICHKTQMNNQYRLPCWLGLEYTNSLQRGTPPSKTGDLGMTLNCIWWWGSSSVVLLSVEHLFIGIIPRFTLTRSGSICLDPVYESNRSIWKLFVLDRNTWFHITECKIELRMVPWRYNSLLKIIIISYMKPYNCVQIICIRKEYLKPNKCVQIICIR